MYIGEGPRSDRRRSFFSLHNAKRIFRLSYRLHVDLLGLLWKSSCVFVRMRATYDEQCRRRLTPPPGHPL